MLQYAISVTEVQSFLLAKHPQQQGARLLAIFACYLVIMHCFK